MSTLQLALQNFMSVNAAYVYTECNIVDTELVEMLAEHQRLSTLIEFKLFGQEGRK